MVFITSPCVFIYLLIIGRVFKSRRSDNSFVNRIDEAKKSLGERIKAGIVELLLLGFSSISSLSLDTVHCINIKDTGLFLYKQATSVECYQPWQIAVFVFVGGWIVLFPFTLYIGTLMLAWKRISSNWFLVSLLFPPSIIVIFFVNKPWRISTNNIGQRRQRQSSSSSYNSNDTDITDPVDPIIPHTISDDDIERSAILLIINEPFRVIDNIKTSKESEEEDEENFTLESDHHLKYHQQQNLIWEPVLLFRRLILLSVSIFIVNPLLKLYPIGVLLALFGIHDYLVRPFSDETNLNFVQTVSSVLLGILALINTFWAFSNNFDLISADPTFHTLGLIFLYFELVVLLFLFIVFVCWLLYRVIMKLYELCMHKQDKSLFFLPGYQGRI